MPELPEVETIRMQLEKVIKGLKIADVQVLMKKSFVGNVGAVKGLKILGVKRRGKVNLIELEKGYLAIHLKLTGQLIYRAKEGAKKVCEKDGPFAVCELPNKYTRVIISFNNGSKLYFNDLRIFGWIKVLRDLKELGEEKFGPEANDEKNFTLEYFQSILSKSRKPVKLLIMDQAKLAGVGNIYANEALFRAKILPARPANLLKEDESRRLRGAIIETLKEAIEHRGSSDRDEAYRQISGEKGKQQNYLQVYGHEGQKCPKGRGVIIRISLGGRGTFYCPVCQK